MLYEQKDIFGFQGQAELYETFRPRYPQAIEDLITF